MRFGFMFLVMVAVFVVAVPGKSRAVGDVAKTLCATVDTTLSMIPTHVGFLITWRIRCSFDEGCWREYKCRSLRLQQQMEDSLGYVCSAVTSYGPDFFPNSSIDVINSDLLDIQSELGNLASLVAPTPVPFDEVAADDAFDRINASLASIDSLLPSVPPEDNRWVRDRGDCTSLEGGVSDEALAVPVNTSEASTDALNAYNTAAQSESDAQLTAEVLVACGEKPLWITVSGDRGYSSGANYYYRAVLSYQGDYNAYWDCRAASPVPCSGANNYCKGRCGSEPYLSSYVDAVRPTYYSDLATWRNCRQLYMENDFEYAPSSEVEGLKQRALNEVGNENPSTVISRSGNQARRICIPNEKEILMPPEALENLDDAMCCDDACDGS